jgi:hypothetical protein
MRQLQVCKHQVCDRCGGRFGMVTHRWWGSKFCKRTCKDAYLREVALDRNTIRRWFGALSRAAQAVGRAEAGIVLEPQLRSAGLSPLQAMDRNQIRKGGTTNCWRAISGASGHGGTAWMARFR